MKAFILVVLIAMSIGSKANDTLRYLSEEEFIHIVRTYHPVAKQAQLMVDRAKAELTASRAGFDPAFYLQTDRKTFDGKTYYDYFNPELKIPTWYGIELKAGLEENLGDNTNPELTKGQSSYVGVSVPLGKNLLMDKRRSVLRQAKLFRDQSKAERLLLINDLLNDAYESYWYWVKHYEVYKILNEAVTVNERRLNLVKLGFRQGDRPAIDTTEALAQLQSFQLARNEALLDFRNSGLMLSNYLWTAVDSPYYLPVDVVPDSSWKTLKIENAGLPVLDELINIARNEHPKLASYDFKLQMLDIEKKLKFQSLLPTLNVNYNILNSGYNVFKDASTALYRNNYKFGIDFGLPLRLSQGRGDYNAAKIKIAETNLDLVQTRLAIDNKVKYHFNELATLQSQVRIAEDNLENYQRLFRGEDTRFRIGESSLFVLNTRENKVLEAQQKLTELKTKFFVSYRRIVWSTGQLR
ncbi:MAG TPA: TolC family protein [Chitinophagaceae bacterium]|nr:TolC family protein [Chitinophagaceae bacterium]